MERDADDRHRKREMIIVGALLLTSGLVLNYLLERHNIFKLWEKFALSDLVGGLLLSAVMCFPVPGGTRPDGVRDISYFSGKNAPLRRCNGDSGNGSLHSFRLRYAVCRDRSRSLRRMRRPRPSCLNHQCDT